MRRLLSPRWLVVHLAALLVIASFLGLGWWQVGRARAGNTLSIAYALQWPLFAAFVIGVWAREARVALRSTAPDARPGQRPATAGQAPATAGQRPVVVPVGLVEADEEDPALTAYNDYLAWLAADPRRRPGEYRREPLQE